MINTIENWDFFAEQGARMGSYQLLNNGELIEVRIQAENLGYKRIFKNNNDPLLIKITDFCKRHGYIQIIERTQETKFFR